MSDLSKGIHTYTNIQVIVPPFPLVDHHTVIRDPFHHCVFLHPPCYCHVQYMRRIRTCIAICTG